MIDNQSVTNQSVVSVITVQTLGLKVDSSGTQIAGLFNAIIPRETREAETESPEVLRLAHLAYTVVDKRPVSNETQGEDSLWRLSSDLPTCSVTFAHKYSCTQTCSHRDTLQGSHIHLKRMGKKKSFVLLHKTELNLLVE